MNTVEFEQKLKSENLNYQNITILDDGYAHIRFTGPFEQQIIIWDAHLYSLAYYNSKKSSSVSFAGRQFIKVDDENESGRQITIALNVPTINEPVIQKTIIMIRQWKNLKRGHHEYGKEVNL